jgi:hypothetical protein
MASTTYHDESDWLSLFKGQKPLRWDALDLNHQANPLRKADGFNITKPHKPQLWRWKQSDATALAWRPQGITGSREAGSPERPRWLAVSWYGLKERGNAQRGARISLVDCERGSPSFLEYRHVLLVQDAKHLKSAAMFRLPASAPAYKQYGGFAPVRIHAGGIAWVGNYLYVADTTLGLRVFDLTKIYAVQADPSKSRCGKRGDAMYAFDYRYVLPQIGYYRMKGAAPHSFVSVGTGTHGRCLWTGSYLLPAAKRTPTLFGWPLRPDGHIDTSRAAERFKPNDSGRHAYNMQGAYRAGGSTWLTVTGRSRHKRSTARLISQAPGKKGVRWRWPHGAEDLYYEADTRTLWCLTEFAASESIGDRFVFGVSLPTYAPKRHPKARAQVVHAHAHDRAPGPAG